jgi:hypothetical protein
MPAIAITAQQDFYEIQSPTDAVTKVHRIILSQLTEVGDAQEEQLSIRVNRGTGTVTSGSGGTTLTPQPIEAGDVGYGGVVEINNTTKMAVGTGTLVNLGEYSWNVRMERDFVYTPEGREVISPGSRLTFELATTPADPITVKGTVEIEEVGG